MYFVSKVEKTTDTDEVRHVPFKSTPCSMLPSATAFQKSASHGALQDRMTFRNLLAGLLGAAFHTAPDYAKSKQVQKLVIGRAGLGLQACRQSSRPASMDTRPPI